MSAWLLSIAGVVVVGVLVELLLSDSTISKFIRSIYALIILFVIVQPLPGLFKNLSDETGGGLEIEINRELMQSINNQTKDAMEKNVVNALSVRGFANVLIMIDIDKGSTTFKINSVFVNALGVIHQSGIDPRAQIISIVTMITGTETGRIHYVG
jgi:hypothetical protein